ncbi:MAG: Type 1 glutamine amidotransferase-like domain-containing protein [Sumerlaeia bacterium]
MDRFFKLAPGALAFSLAASVSLAITQESENNDTDKSADGPLVSGTTVAGDLGRNDVDWFTLDVAAGTISISLNHHNRDDFDWYLFPASGGYVASGATSSNPETGSYTASAGTYFIKVEAYRGRGWYDLNVTFSEDSGGGGGDPGGGGGGTCDYGTRPSKPGGLTNYLDGSSADVCVDPMTGPGILLMGGNFDIDEAFTTYAAPIVDGGDVVVLRASGSDGYNNYLMNLLNPDSVETLVLDSVSDANSTYADWVIRSAEMVYIAGGDQTDYIDFWKGTATEDAIRHVYEKGGVVGGISAGCAIMGEFVYAPTGYGVYSSEAISDPCHQYMSEITTDFLNLPLGNDIITDTHFAQRDRMGRLLVFMARIREASLSPTSGAITGIGMDEDTSMFIDSNGVGHVQGDFSAYVLREDGQTNASRVQCGSSVLYYDVLNTELQAGDTFNFGTGANTGSTSRVDVNGSGTSPSNPY